MFSTLLREGGKLSVQCPSIEFHLRFYSQTHQNKSSTKNENIEVFITVINSHEIGLTLTNNFSDESHV